MSATIGNVFMVNGPVIGVKTDFPVRHREIAFVDLGETKLKAETIKIDGADVYMQVFEETSGVKVGTPVQFTGDLLSVTLGPGLLSETFDGLQNPLYTIADQYGIHLPRGKYVDALPKRRAWEFTPSVSVGSKVESGSFIGSVPEKHIKHQIMVPFDVQDGTWTVQSIVEKGKYSLEDVVCTVKHSSGQTRELFLSFKWPVKIPIRAYKKRILPTEPLITGLSELDTFFPLSKGGTACIPGPFGAGKTVAQQKISQYADIDIVIVAACGERAGEVVETIREFPELIDPKTGKSLMDRTIIVCNTSAMPVPAREASVYTAVTMAEYYGHMGLNVLLLGDSTSRWAQALREVSALMERIPGEEGFPSDLESIIPQWYERAGAYVLKNGMKGSVTIIGTVSPAGGSFAEPVTQITLSCVGAFWGLTYDRSQRRRFPSVDPLISWSKYRSAVAAPERIKAVLDRYKYGVNVYDSIKLMGADAVSIDDFMAYQLSEWMDFAYMQQNSFDDVDACRVLERQQQVFKTFYPLATATSFKVKSQAEAEAVVGKLISHCREWNYKKFNSADYDQYHSTITQMIGGIAA